MDSGLQDKGERHPRLRHESSAVGALVLVLVLLMSALALTVPFPNSADLNDEAEHGAQTTSVDPNSLTLSASPTHAYFGDNITFYANGSSFSPGAPLTISIFYDYYLNDGLFSVNNLSPVSVNYTTSPGFVIQTHAYSQPGNWTDGTGTPYFWVALWVDDGESNETWPIRVYVTVYVPPVNAPPRFDSYPFCPAGAFANESQKMEAFVADNDSDTVTMFWDFGDGTNATNVTVATPTGVFIRQTHTWSPRIPGQGDYHTIFYMNVSLTDGLHPPVNYTAIADIATFINFPPDLQVSTPNAVFVQDKPVIFTASATDAEGDPLTWTFNYSDGSLEVFYTGYTDPNKLVWMNVTHVYSTLGDYTVTISLSDALVPNQVWEHNITTSLLLTVVANRLPTLFSIDMTPGAPIINETIGNVNVTFTVNAFDPDGDVVTLTWDFGGGEIRTNISSGVIDVQTFIQVVRYSEVGSYSITLNGTDGLPGHTVFQNRTANISSNNRAPEVIYFDKGPTRWRDFPQPNEIVNITITMRDREHNALDVSIDFGDGSPLMNWTNLTDYIDGNITLLVSHSYVKKGDYVVVLVVTDNKVGGFNHTRTYILPLKVDDPPVIFHQIWDWWDYASLALFIMMPVLSVAGAIQNRRHRRQIEDQGMTYDEWKLKREVVLKGLDK